MKRSTDPAQGPVQQQLFALLYEVRELLRRVLPEVADKPLSQTLRFGTIVLDLDRLSVSEDGRVVVLASRELMVLRYLLQRVDRVVTRDQLLTDVWSYDYMGDARTVDVHVSRLRRKLPSLRDRLVAVKHVGYRLVNAANVASDFPPSPRLRRTSSRTSAPGSPDVRISNISSRRNLSEIPHHYSRHAPMRVTHGWTRLETGVMRAIVFGCVVSLMSVSGAFAQVTPVAAPTWDKGWIDVNFGVAVAAEKDYFAEDTFTRSLETGYGAALYTLPTGASFDFGGGYMFTSRLGAGISLRQGYG